jgi:filamentous hemagglutinin family protein
MSLLPTIWWGQKSFKQRFRGAIAMRTIESRGFQLSVLRRVGAGILCWGLAAAPATAQITSDRTLPQPTRVTPQGNTLEITGGTRTGDHLFHSFERFSVPTNGTAFFNNDAAITNIFSRVTGRSLSQIDGELRANGGANLFLINPNGIIFGANASLNIGGSFVGSTANSIQFANGGEYSAVNPDVNSDVNSLLTISVPIGLQFGEGGETGQIQVQGNGHNLFLNSPTDPSVNRSDRPVGLRVNPGQTLALVGSNLTLQGGNLTAAGGQIELGSVDSGQVSLESLPDAPGWKLGYDDVLGFGDITLTQAASLEASGDRGGTIQVQGRRIRIGGASAMLADTLGTGDGGSLRLQAFERVRIAGFSAAPFVSRLSTDVAPSATGQGGDLSIVTPILDVADGAQISSGTFGAGNAGTLRLQTETLRISGSSPIGPSGLFVPVSATAIGNGGRLDVTTDLLQIDGAQISATTFGAGNAGRLSLRANQVDLQNGSSIAAIVERGASGNGDRSTLVADQLRLGGGSQITTLTAGTGNAGDMNIRAREIEIAGGAGRFASGFLASVEPEATGRGGRMVVQADRLRLLDGGEISTITFGAGRAGNLLIDAGEVEINGGSPSGPSSLLAASRGTGTGGRLRINADRLQVNAGGQIATATAGSGDAGDLTIAANSVELVGGNAFGRSGLFSSAIEGTGAGGNIQMTVDRLRIADGAIVSVSNFPSNPSAQAGSGGVGNLILNANQIVLDSRSLLTADSNAGDRGNISLQSGNIVLLQESAITTNAQGNARGGNINLDTNLLTATGNSDITANAVSDFGGQVAIAADAVLGTQIRPQLTSQSDITAFSELGAQFSGTVQLDAPIIDPSRGLVELPEIPVDASNQIAAACAETEGSEFVITGRGGLPEAPVQILRGGTIWEDLRTSSLGNQERGKDRLNAVQNESVEGLQSPVEAQGWQVDESGQVVLVAQAPPIALRGSTLCAAEVDP